MALSEQSRHHSDDAKTPEGTMISSLIQLEPSGCHGEMPPVLPDLLVPVAGWTTASLRVTRLKILERISHAQLSSASLGLSGKLHT